MLGKSYNYFAPPSIEDFTLLGNSDLPLAFARLSQFDKGLNLGSNSLTFNHRAFKLNCLWGNCCAVFFQIPIIRKRERETLIEKRLSGNRVRSREYHMTNPINKRSLMKTRLNPIHRKMTVVENLKPGNFLFHPFPAKQSEQIETGSKALNPIIR